ncbi:MAG TPA: hypothetical protein VMG41_04195 [Gemmatimonadales bacterium]|nr:hypothetical protein [Gemmatimonadales bacterium]
MKFLLFIAAVVGALWYFYKPLPPGKGPGADTGKRVAVVIQRTLENYRGDHGGYPQALEDLVPTYLSSVPLLSTGRTFDYQRLGLNYKLTFNYANPLPVHCSYEPATKWQCEWF